MRTPTVVLALAGLTMITTFILTHPVNLQSPLTEEGKKKLGSYDPADIFPDARESGRKREKSRQPSDSRPVVEVTRKSSSPGQGTSSAHIQFRQKNPSSQSTKNETAQSPLPSVEQSSQTMLTTTSHASSPRAKTGSVSASKIDSGSHRKSIPLLILVSLIALALVILILTIVKLMKLSAGAG